MNLNDKFTETIALIKGYNYTPNSQYLYPLNESVLKMNNLFNFESENEGFNSYLKEVLLNCYNFYVNIVIDEKRNKHFDLDADTIKQGSEYWHNLFLEACKFYSVDALTKEGY